MKVKSTLFLAAVIVVLSIKNTVTAQQYKMRQSTTMAGMKSESTIYVKAMRKRTEAGSLMGMTSNTTIEQCDLQRIIHINDKKKLYFIESFSKGGEDIKGDDSKTATSKNKLVAAASMQTNEKTGGIINMWYNVTDTGERKKIYGFTARHVWTTQKIKPSPNACTMKDSMIIKTDGWYIDLPQFNCPVQFNPNNISRPATMNQPECRDRYVSKRSGKGKLGFPLKETKILIMGNGAAETTEFETTIETLEFSTAKLDSMLFEIPLGYKLSLNEEELNDNLDVCEMMKQDGTSSNNRGDGNVKLNQQKKAGIIRVGVYEPKSQEHLEFSALQQQLVNTFLDDNVEAVAISSKEEAKKYNCDLLLITDIIRVKQGNKIGGLLKAIKNTNPFAVSSYNIEADLTLANFSDGSIHIHQKVNGKYEGKPVAAAAKALDDGCRHLLKELK